MSDCPSPERAVLCISIGDLTSKIALLFLTLLTSHKLYTEYYWLFYIENQQGEWLILILLYILLYWTTKATSSAVIYFIMMIILYLIWMFTICHLSSLFLQIFNQWSLVISAQFFEAFKELYTFRFLISIYTSIGKYTISIS